MNLPLKHLIAANVFGSYCVPEASQHRPAAMKILAGDVWEPETIAFLAANCGAGDIVHAGTYFGDFLPALSKAVAPTAHIWAFEPSRENFECASMTLNLNNIHNVTLRHAALGACAGTVLLQTGETGVVAAGGSSRVEHERRFGFDYEETLVVTIDAAVPADRHLSILQLDVEHYEQEALAGALVTIRRCRPVLVLENKPKDPAWFAETILSLGYRQTGKLHRNRVFRTRRASDGSSPNLDRESNL